jgi:PST family polysaccharide transporter
MRNENELKKRTIIELFKESSLLKTTLKNASHVVVRFILGFLNIKILAYLVGPAGMAMVGQFQNFLQLGANISGLGFSNGIVKNISQHQESPSKQHLIISTALVAVFICALLVGIAVLIGAHFFSVYIFKSDEYVSIVRFSGVYFISSSIVVIYMALLNGLEKLSRFIKINILLSTSGFVIALLAIYTYQLQGVLWAQLFLFLVAFIQVIIVLKHYFKGKKIVFSFVALSSLSNYGIMALVSGVLGPLTYFVIRRIIANALSWEVAGMWEGLNKISTNYIALVSMSFSYYFLPTFSRLTNYTEIRSEIKRSLVILIIVLICGALGVYWTKGFIIQLLFTNHFKSMEGLFFWQVVGDFFKILSWVIGYLFIAKEKVKIYLYTEISSSLLQIGMAYFFINAGFNITMYYGLENMIYFGIMLGCYHWYFGKR